MGATRTGAPTPAPEPPGRSEGAALTLRVARGSERPELVERAEAIDVWPEYQHHGDVVSRYWRRLRTEFPASQYVLYEDATNEVVAHGHAVPVTWDGSMTGLPSGIDEALTRAFEERREPDTLCALAVEIAPSFQGRGHAATTVEAMIDIARDLGLRDLIAPVRPSWKERFPLEPIAVYARRTREDGLPFDPWLRVHVRLGGEILAIAPRSLRISGSVADWERWTGTPFPISGTHVFPHALGTVDIDLAADRGTYWEPNIWVRHRVD